MANEPNREEQINSATGRTFSPSDPLLGPSLIPAQEFVEICTTLPDDIIADDIAEKLVAARLVACAQVTGPVESTYLWQGKIEQSSEHKLTLKTTLERLAAVIQIIRSRHPYQVPEITVRRYDAMSSSYADWIRESVAESSLNTTGDSDIAGDSNTNREV